MEEGVSFLSVLLMCLNDTPSQGTDNDEEVLITVNLGHVKWLVMCKYWADCSLATSSLIQQDAGKCDCTNNTSSVYFPSLVNTKQQSAHFTKVIAIKMQYNPQGNRIEMVWSIWNGVSLL